MIALFTLTEVIFKEWKWINFLKNDIWILWKALTFLFLQKYMPPPPEDADIRTMPYFDFSSVECLLYAFHRLARQCPDFLTHDQQVLKDFRARLMYFARGVQGCTKALNNFTIKDKSTSEEDRKKQKISPLVLSNINTLIKDLFYTPPVYKCNVKLSFKSLENSSEVVSERFSRRIVSNF